MKLFDDTKLKELKPIDYRLIVELIKNPTLSDRQIARTLGVSQPTVLRRRGELEKEMLLNYTAIPNLSKLGFEIIAATLAIGRGDKNPEELMQRALDFWRNHPNTIFVSTGSGFGSDRVILSAHKSYSDYVTYIKDLERDWGEFAETKGSFIIGLRHDNMLSRLTFEQLAEGLAKEKSA